jgi:hypothetical protein
VTEALDAVWIDAAARLGIAVARGGDGYVHWNGRELLIALDEELDDDDSIAQLVLHELCHWLVEGAHARVLADWGLDNTSDRDLAREHAAVRLQAHLLGAYGLRGVLFPTTSVRAFFIGLGDDAFAPAGAESSRLARVAAGRAARPPFSTVLFSALAASAALVAAPRHPQSGWPLAGGDRTCAGCVWRTVGRLCRQAPTRARVAPDAPACVRWEGALDCQACAACCREAYGSVTVGRRDPVVEHHPALIVDRGRYLEIARAGERCAALSGQDGGPFVCAIYDGRPRPCREFAAGGRHCLDARRRTGLAMPLSRLDRTS